MTIQSSTRALDDTRGVVRVEGHYDTDVEDLWQACTTPERLARWLAEVTGDLHEGGTVQLLFTSTWSGPARVEVCDAPHHLLLTTQPGTDEEGQIEAWLTVEGTGTRLVVEDRGLPLRELPMHDAGWQAHLEDLEASLANPGPVHPGGWSEQSPATGWRTRWAALAGRD